MPTPGGKCAAAAALRKFIGQALQSPTLREEITKNPDERIRFAGSISFSASCTEYRVEKSHSLLDFERLLQNRIRGTCAAKGIFPG